jgi:hypothetical protein
MAELAELQQELACLLGLTQATGQLARRGAVLADQEGERELAEALQRLGGAGEQVQRRLQLLVARHARLRAGWITATSRRVKASILGRCGEGATMQDLLRLLTTAVDGARASAIDLAGCNPPDDDRAVAEFADFAVSNLEGQATAVTRAFPPAWRAGASSLRAVSS